jgi:hypothetical protein
MKYLIRSLFSIALIAGLLLISGCGSGTKVTGFWQEYPDKSFTFNKIGIIGISKNPAGRKAVEAYLNDMLADKGYSVVGGYLFLPPQANEENLTLDLLVEFLKTENVDAVITVSLLRTKDSKQYVSGSYYYSPWSEARFGDYYGQMRNYLYAPGYTIESRSYFLESNLYSFPEGELLWSAQTKSTDVYDLDRGAKSVAQALVQNLVQTKTIIP